MVDVGCKPSEPSGPAPAPKLAAAKIPGWTEAKASGFSMSFPKDWTVIDFATGDFEKILQVMEKDPSTKNFVDQCRQSAKDGTYRLMAIDAKSGTGNNVNVVMKDLPGSLTLDEAADSMKHAVETQVAPGSHVDQTPLKLPAGDFMKLRTELKSGTEPMVSTMCITIHNNQLVALTYTCGKAAEAKFSPVIDQSLQSLRFD